MPKIWTTSGSGSGSGGGNSFTIMQPITGTSPTADSPNDTLNFTSSDSSIGIAGNSTTDTLDFTVNMSAVGDVDGPASSTDNAVVRFDGTTGKLIQNSVAILSDAGALSGLTGLVSSGLTYPTADGTANFPIKTNGSGTLSVGTISKNATIFGGGTEGQVLYVNNASPNNGIDNNANFLFNSTTLGVRFGPTLSESYTAYSTTFLSRFWARSVSGFFATVIYEHQAGGPGEFPNVLLAKSNGTNGAPTDVVNADGCGAIFWQGYKTGTYANIASVAAIVDGTPAIFSIPGRLQLSVTKAGDFLSTVVQDIRSDFSTTLIGGLVINDSGFDQDTRIEGDTNANLFYVDASTDRIGIGTSTPAVLFNVNGVSGLDGATVVNESGAAVNFRVEGDTNANLLVTDGTNDRVGIGTASPTVLFHVNGASNLDGATVVNETGAAVNFRVESDTEANLIFTDGTNNRVGIATASPSVLFHVNGTSNLDGACVVNESGANVDMRVEGDTDANLVFVDASADSVGIGNNAPDNKLHVTGTSHFTGVQTTDAGKVRAWVQQTGNFNFDSTMDMVEGAPAAGGLTGTLPAASGVAQGTVYRCFTGTAVGAANGFAVTRSGSDTVNGAATITVTRASVEFSVVRTSSTTWRLYQ